MWSASSPCWNISEDWRWQYYYNNTVCMSELQAEESEEVMFDKKYLTDYEEYLLRKVINTIIRLERAEESFNGFMKQFLYPNNENMEKASIHKNYTLIEDLFESISSIVPMDTEESTLIVKAIHEERNEDKAINAIQCYLARNAGVIIMPDDEDETVETCTTVQSHII